MVDVVPNICVGEPASFADVEIGDFVAFVLAGGEVSAKGLYERVNSASHIVYARENKCLLGVGGLKTPSESYRRRVERSSGMNLPVDSVPFELGWVFVLPSARGRQLCAALCRPLIALADGRGVFSTSRTDNEPMHRTLRKLGFNRVGNEWPSSENEGTLALFIREALKTSVTSDR